jgi:glycosyltransferase involved in cell wall biosynthesis
MVAEGTYPYAHGGVSTWCDQLVRGLAEHEFDLVAITGTGSERQVWELPPNVRSVQSIPLWGPARSGGRGGLRSRRLFLPRAAGERRPATAPDLISRTCVRDFGLALVEPDLQVAGRRFRAALREWSRLAPTHDLESELTATEFIDLLMQGWSADELTANWGGRGRGVPTVGDAVTAARLLAHTMRPLAHPAPEADVVHLVANGIAGLVGMAAKWRHGTPYLLSEHGVYLRERYLAFSRSHYSRPVKWLLLRFHRLLASAVYAEAALVAPGNVYNQRWELWDGVPDSAIRTVYNGVDTDEFAFADAEPNVPTISWAGRIDPIKDLETLVRGFALVSQEMPEARLRVFGGTPAGNEEYRDQVVALTGELGIVDQVSFEGRVDTIQDAYAAGNVVALTSVSEGFPYTVIEAMSCGRATVSTDVGGVAEAVGEAGLIVPPGDPAAFAAACLRLLREDDERRALAEKARERVVELFTLEQSLDAFRTIYQDVAGSGPAEEGAAA